MIARFHSMLFLFVWLSALIHFTEIGHAFVTTNTPSPFFSVKTTSLSTSSDHRILFKSLDFDNLNGYSNLHIKTERSSSLLLSMEKGDGEKSTSNLPFWLDPGTRGGAIVLSVILFILPLLGYSVATNIFGVDGVDAGTYIGVGFTASASLVWLTTYIFRVATKDMTYAKQLKDYENTVIAKRLEELDDDEIQALVEEIERDDF
mmetsp:Transcript_55087/g.61537  ORF Transcript_55087/g.61537 Transcript_55087/m.61537 type:complete len:204 (-) Transcript_55087:543-1154(-)